MKRQHHADPHDRILAYEGRSTRLDEREAHTTARASIRERIQRLGLSEAMQWPVIGG